MTNPLDPGTSVSVSRVEYDRMTAQRDTFRDQLDAVRGRVKTQREALLLVASMLKKLEAGEQWQLGEARFECEQALSCGFATGTGSTRIEGCAGCGRMYPGGRVPGNPGPVGATGATGPSDHGEEDE